MEMTKKKKPEDKVKTGRPTDYRPEFCQEMIKYFSIGLYKEGYKKELNALPTVQYYAAHIRGVTVQTLHNWAKVNPEFLEAFNIAKTMQENLLVQGGISRAYDGGFTKFILNSVSDTFKEKVEHSLDLDTKNVIKLAYALPIKEENE